VKDQKVTFLPRLNVEFLQEETLLFLAGESSTDGALLDIMAKYFLTAESLIRKILKHPNVLKSTRDYVRLFGAASCQESIPDGAPSLPSQTETETKPTFENLFQQVQQMGVSEKISLALKGNKEARALLIKDSNKQVVLAVLNSPRLTEQEVEMIALSKNVSEEILRVIGNNRSWIKNYLIVAALVNNSKTPIGLSLGFLKNLKVRDLGIVAKNKNIPEVIRSSAHKLLQLKKTGI
jgi:hypothetical protein